jgi:hypothetical protein
MSKISDLTAISTAISGDDLVPVVVVGSPNVTRKSKVSELLAGGIQPIQDPTALNGTTDATTARLIYGINVIRTSTTSDFCARLPLTPQKGKSVVVVNLGPVAARIFPSVTGGKINNVVDGHVDIAPSAQAVTIYCYENPDPGDWTTPYIPLSNVITIPDFSIAHTNGVADNQVGTVQGTVITSGIGSGSDGNGNLILTPSSPNWGSENAITTLVRMKVYTNIIANDCASAFAFDAISFARYQAYKTGSSSTTSGARDTFSFNNAGLIVFGDVNSTGGAVNGGTMNSPIEIGDNGTLYGERIADVNAGNQIGLGGAFSRYYYIFGIAIPANAVTKTYKFRVQLEYL